MRENQFIKLLEDEAKNQAKLNEKKILPDKIGHFASLFVKNMWKIIGTISGVMAIIKVYYL